MNYSINLFSNLIFHFLEIIQTAKILNNVSSCEILIFQTVELFFFISRILKFYEIVNYKKISQLLYY